MNLDHFVLELGRSVWLVTQRLAMAAVIVGGCQAIVCGQPTPQTRIPDLQLSPSLSPTPTGSDGDHAWSRLSRLLSLQPPDGTLPSRDAAGSPQGTEPPKLLERLPPTTNRSESSQPKSTAADDSSKPSDELASGRWHLAALETIALRHSPAVERAIANVKAAHGQAVQAGLAPNPLLGIDYQQIGSSGLAEQFGATVEQEFVVREKLALNREVIFQEIQRLEYELGIERQRVLTDVRVAFVRALKAQKQLELLRDLVSISDQARVISEKLFQAEEVGKTDVLQAEVEVQRAKVALAQALNRRRAAWQELAAVIGQPDLPWKPVTGELKGPVAERDFAHMLAELRSSSPQVAMRSAEIQRARCNLRRQQIEPRPNLTVQGLVNWRDNGIGGRSDGALTVSLPIPVWDRNQGAIQAAYHELIAADQQRNVLELQLQQQLAEVYERYRNAQQQTSQFEQAILPKAAEVLTLIRTAYEIGEIEFVNLLTAQRSYAQFQLDYLDALEELRIAEFEMDGLLLSGSLRD